MFDRKGLVAPLRRDKKRDFAYASGDGLLKSKIVQVLATQGEMPWATSFGSGLNRLRHQKNNNVLSELARVYVREALRKWVPEVDVLKVEAKRDGEKLHLEVGYRVSSSGESGDYVNVVV